ncbi:MAG: cytochrome c3 family protein, partial [bacterium]|nr:cytochrome c3 family protein [bacterium]
MSDQKPTNPLIFPRWLDKMLPVAGIVLAGGPLFVFGLLFYGGSPTNTDVGYQPEQPVPYSHKLHAGELGIDCRYCHSLVDKSAHASIPATETCMNCHAAIYTESPNLVAVRESYATGLPVRWVRVHDLPDYTYFNHSAHVTRGVGCVECHGRIDKMEVVYQDEPLNMGWCLDCHRNPGPRLRPVEEVTNMAWQPGPGEQAELAERLIREYEIAPSE